MFGYINLNIAAILHNPVRLVNIIGKPRDIIYGDLLRTAVNPSTFLFLVFVVAVLVLLNANSYLLVLTLPAVILVWSIGVLVVALSYIILIFLWNLLNFVTGRRAVFLPLIAAISTFSTVVAIEFSASLLSDHPFSVQHSLMLVPYTFLVILTFDLVHFLFALPVIQARALKRQPRVQKAMISLANHQFSPGSIDWAMSQDHYLNIATEGRKKLILARISDLVDQIQPAEGIQPHRSWWISANAVQEIVKDEKGETVVMRDGTRVPIARGRIAEVRVWFADHQKRSGGA